MGSNFFDWDQEPDDEEEQDSQTPSAPEAPAAVEAAPEGEEPSAAPQEAPPSAGDEVPDDELNNESEQKFEELHSSQKRQQLYSGDAEKKKVGAIASRELAWGLASRTLDSIPFTGDTLDRIREAARNRSESELGLAQDLRLIAGDHPQFADELHNAADKLIKAHQQISEAGNVPSNALPLGSEEANQKLTAKNQEIAKKQEELKTAGLLRAPSLKNELMKLRTEQGALANTVSPSGAGADPASEAGPSKPPSPNANIAAHMDGTPGGYSSYLQAIQDKTSELQKMGINIQATDLMKHMPMDTALSMLMKSDPQDMSGFRKFLMQQQDPSGRGEPGVAFNAKGTQGDDPALLQIQAKQQRYGQLMQQLGHMHESQNWLSAIGMFITAILVGPKAALTIWGRAGQERSLQLQLHAMHEDINQSIQMRSQQQNMDYRNRALAARQANQQTPQDKMQQRMTEMYFGHLLALDRAKQSHGLKDQDAKDLADEFKHHMSIAAHEGQTANSQAILDENVRNQARQKMDSHMKAAEAINKILAVPESKK